MDRASNFYANPTHGGAFPVFIGSRRRRGGGILGILKSFAMPMLKGVVRQGATQALGMAKDVMGDLASGQSLKSSVMRHGVRRAKRLGSDVLQSAMGSFSNRSQPTQPAVKRRRMQQRRHVSKARQTTKRRRSNF